jgi:hypothetical protein
MLLESFHQFENHTPGFFWVCGEVILFTLFCIGELPLSLGSSLLLQQTV